MRTRNRIVLLAAAALLPGLALLLAGGLVRADECAAPPQVRKVTVYVVDPWTNGPPDGGALVKWSSLPRVGQAQTAGGVVTFTFPWAEDDTEVIISAEDDDGWKGKVTVTLDRWSQNATIYLVGPVNQGGGGGEIEEP